MEIVVNINTLTIFKKTVILTAKFVYNQHYTVIGDIFLLNDNNKFVAKNFFRLGLFSKPIVRLPE